MAHDPAQRARFLQISAKGGRGAAQLDPSEVGPPPRTKAELVEVLGETIQHVRCGRLGYRRGLAVLDLAKFQLAVLEGKQSDGPAPSTISDEALPNQLPLAAQAG